MNKGDIEFKELQSKFSNECFQLLLKHGITSFNELQSKNVLGFRLKRYSQEINTVTGKAYVYK